MPLPSLNALLNKGPPEAALNKLSKILKQLSNSTLYHVVVVLQLYLGLNTAGRNAKAEVIMDRADQNRFLELPWPMAGNEKYLKCM